MSALRLRLLVWAGLFAAIAGLAVSRFDGGLPLQTNLLALLPATERNPLAERAVEKLADAAGNRAVFLVGGDDAERTREAARRFGARLQQSDAFKRVIVDVAAFDPRRVIDAYRPYRFNLLSENDRQAVSGGATTVAERLLRKLVSPVPFGLALPLADDPFGFADGWLARLPFGSLRVQPEDGLLVVRDGTRLWVLVNAELAGSAYDNGLQHAVVGATDAAESVLRVAYPEAELLKTGTVFYAADARSHAENEMDFIGAGSLLGMLTLLYLMFRSFRPLALGLVSVVSGLAAATVVSVFVFGELHLITLVFGAALIGEAIDYAIQYFAAHLGAGAFWEPLAGLRRIAPALTVALATSLMGYGALMLLPFPALSQIALFAFVGLGAAWLTVFLLLPALLRAPARDDPAHAMKTPGRWLECLCRHGTRRRWTLLFVVLIGVAGPGCLRLVGNDDVHLLVSRSPVLVAQEEAIRTRVGVGTANQFFLVEGDSAGAVLAVEEQLAARLEALSDRRALDGFVGVSSFVPSPAAQAAARRLWAEQVFADEKLMRQRFAEAGLREALADRLLHDFRASADRPMRVEDWLAEPWSAPYRHLWLGETGSGVAGIVQLSGARDLDALAAAAAGLPGVSFVDKAAGVSHLFERYRQAGVRWFCGACLLVYGVLALRYGLRDAFFVVLPTLVALIASHGLFGYLDLPMTLFNLMGAMLVLGVGVNYAIFLHEGGARSPATFAGVLLSAGTTLLSFGLLSFSSMPALSGFGLTLLSGIGLAVVLTPSVLAFGSERKVGRTG